MDVESQLKKLGACTGALDWVAGRTLAECYSAPDVPPDFATWLVVNVRWYLPAKVQLAFEAAVFAAADRAVRTYAPRALEAASMASEAARLRALPQVVDVATAKVAQDVAADARAAALACGEASVVAAWTSADAVAAAARAARGVWVFAADVAAAAAQAARRVDAKEEELTLQFKALRAVVPLEVMRRALDSATREAPTPEQQL